MDSGLSHNLVMDVLKPQRKPKCFKTQNSPEDWNVFKQRKFKVFMGNGIEIRRIYTQLLLYHGRDFASR